MENTPHLDRVHSEALRAEIGDRLRIHLSHSRPALTSRLEALLIRLGERDGYHPQRTESSSRAAAPPSFAAGLLRRVGLL